MTNDNKADCLWLTLNLLVGLEWPTTKRQSEDSVPDGRSFRSSKSDYESSESRSRRSKSSSRTKSTTENDENEEDEISTDFVVVLPKIDCR